MGTPPPLVNPVQSSLKLDCVNCEEPIDKISSKLACARSLHQVSNNSTASIRLERYGPTWTRVKGKLVFVWLLLILKPNLSLLSPNSG